MQSRTGAKIEEEEEEEEQETHSDCSFTPFLTRLFYWRDSNKAFSKGNMLKCVFYGGTLPETGGAILIYQHLTLNSPEGGDTRDQTQHSTNNFSWLITWLWNPTI